MRKTNLEELNYRVRKELLNNYGYRRYFELLHQVQSSNYYSDFNYDAWAKGLFKGNDDESKSLIASVSHLYDGMIRADDDSYWDDDYKRTGRHFIDIINISEITSMWVSCFNTGQRTDEYLWHIGLSIANSLNDDEYEKFVNEDLGTGQVVLKKWAIVRHYQVWIRKFFDKKLKESFDYTF